MRIGRTLFWFREGDEMLISLNERFFSLGTLLNRLLNEVYTGPKIKFINLDFSTGNTYELHPVLPKGQPYYYGGHMRFYGLIDLNKFAMESKLQQEIYIWEEAYKYLLKVAEKINNKNLMEAATYAYDKGIENSLNPDYKMIVQHFNAFGKNIVASLWINFKEEGMYSKLILEDDSSIIFERIIDESKNGVDFFLEMYSGLVLDGTDLIITGSKDVDYLPLRIDIRAVAGKNN